MTNPKILRKLKSLNIAKEYLDYSLNNLNELLKEQNTSLDEVIKNLSIEEQDYISK